MDRTAARFALWVLLGTLLLQAAWVLALPPFRGIDEFDHAYRAAAVADGQWLPSGRTDPDARGELVRVPTSLVEDAGPVCSLLGYTRRYNCEPMSTTDDGEVAVVATAASRYHPAFYWVVGTVARPFDGAAALTAMRLTNALLCSLLVAVGAWVTARWSTTVWPRLAFLAALTPVTLYAAAVAAPNGVEAISALVVWTSLVGLRRARPGDRVPMAVLATACAVPLATVRGLGPLWLTMVLLLAAVWAGPSEVRRAARSGARVALGAAVVVVVALAASAAWIVGVGSLDLEEDAASGSALVGTALSVPLWLLQAVAAFPLRNEPAPMIVYATGLLALAGLLTAGLVRGSRRDRGVVLLCLVLAVAVPFALQVQIFDVAGLVWQGRYGWPLGLGVLVLVGAVLDQRPPGHPLVQAAVPLGLVLWGVAHVASVIGVHLGELQESPLAGDPRWVTVPAWGVGALAVLGVAAWGAGVLRGAAYGAESPPGRTEVPPEGPVGAGRPATAAVGRAPSDAPRDRPAPPVRTL